MAKPTTSRPVQVLVLGCLALLVAIGGTATAVTRIGTKALKNRAVTTKKLRDGAVTGAKLADGAVKGGHVEDASLGLEDVAQGIVPVSIEPPPLGPGACFTDNVDVPGMQGTEQVLVLPGASTDGWPANLILQGYGPDGPASVRIRVCNGGGTALDGDPLPLTVLILG